MVVIFPRPKRHFFFRRNSKPLRVTFFTVITFLSNSFCATRWLHGEPKTSFRFFCQPHQEFFICDKPDTKIPIPFPVCSSGYEIPWQIKWQMERKKKHILVHALPQCIMIETKCPCRTLPFFVENLMTELQSSTKLFCSRFQKQLIILCNFP